MNAPWAGSIGNYASWIIHQPEAETCLSCRRCRAVINSAPVAKQDLQNKNGSSSMCDLLHSVGVGVRLHLHCRKALT